MQTGALIVAAGKSSRMGDFKPMLQLGSISIAQRVINNFRQAGISKVVVVTGYKADVLERHLASNNVIFLRNEDYATTHMFDSVRIGLEYLKDKVDTVLFTPVDVPLFTARTVTQMLSADHPLVTPVCEGKPGHPILLRSSLIDSILRHTHVFSECGGSRNHSRCRHTRGLCRASPCTQPESDPFRNPHSAGSRKSIL